MKRRRKFYFRITRTFVLLTIILATATYASLTYVYNLGYLFIAQEDNQDRSSISLAAHIVDERINTILTDLQGLAHHPSTYDISKKNIEKSLKLLREETKKRGYLRMSLTDFNGNTITTNGQKFNIAENRQFQKTIRGFSTTSGITLKRMSDSPHPAKEAITFNVPVFMGATVIGVLSATIGLEKASYLLKDIDKPYNGASLFIIDADNCVITHSGVFTDKRMYLGRSCSFFDFMSGILDFDEQDLIRININDLPWDNVFSYKTKQYSRYLSFAPLPNTDGWKLVSVSSEEGLLAAHRNILYKATTLFIIAILIVIAAILFLYIVLLKYGKMKRLSRTALDKSGLYLFMLSMHGDAEKCDKNFIQFLDLPEKTECFNFTHFMDKKQTLFPLDSIKKEDSFRLSLHMPDGRELYLLIQVIGEEEGGLYQSFAVDITKDEQIQEQVRNFAFIDLTTGLPNKKSCTIKIGEINKKCMKEEFKSAFIFIDINDSRKILEIFGNKLSGMMLHEAAYRLSTVADNFGGTLFSLGIDNFVLILDNYDNKKSLINISEKINKIFFTPFILGDGTFEVTCRIGVVFCPEYLKQTPVSPNNIFRYGEFAVSYAKKTSNLYLFDMEEYLSIINERDIKIDLLQSIKNNELELYFQPIYNFHKDSITGFEALLRWISPKHGNIPPDVFIPIAEKSGFINYLGDFVIDNTINFAEQLKAKNIKVGFNVSIIQFMQADFVCKLLTKFSGHNFAPDSIMLEITESCLYGRVEEMKEKLDLIRNAGILVSIDDFGTGYSSLSYLKDLPTDYLKIDKSFIKDIETSEKQRAIISSIIAVAKSLDIIVIAEGVETKGQLDIIVQTNCHLVQGFLIAQPMPEKETLAFIESFNGINDINL